MIYRIPYLGLEYEIQCNDTDMIERAFRRAQSKYEEEDYADFFMIYFSDELDKLGVVHELSTEHRLKW